MDDAMDGHLERNRRVWNAQARNYVAAGEACWASPEPSWGIFGVPEAELQLLPRDLSGQRTIELGCGTAYVSAWMATWRLGHGHRSIRKPAGDGAPPATPARAPVRAGARQL